MAKSKYKVDPATEDFLTEFGLSEREIVLYVALLNTGPNTIMNLSRETGVKRSTTHNNVEELIKKGLVSQTNYGERRMVVAENPDKLKLLMQQKKYRIEKMADNLPDVIGQIQEMIPDDQGTNHVDVKYYEGKDPTSVIYKEAFEADELSAYVNLAVSHNIFPENGVLFAELQKEGNAPKVRDIIDASQETQLKASVYAKNPKFEYRVSTETLNLSAVNILMFSNKVAIVNYKDNISGTVIDNKAYYDSSMAIFELIWKMLPKPEAKN